MPGKVRPALIAVVAVLGFMLAIAFNSNMRTLDSRPRRASDLRSSDLAGFVREMEDQRRDLRASLSELRARESALEAQAAAAGGRQRSVARELEAGRAQAGLSVVRGAGLTVELADAKSVPTGADANDYIIHDFDVSSVVNALFAGGASAVSVNGERVIATTAIRCAGNTILVNATRLGSPYRIVAVGDAARLRRALDVDRSTGVLLGEYVEQFGIGATVTESRVSVPAYRGSIRPVVAQPLEGSEKS